MQIDGENTGGFASFRTSLKSPFELNVLTHALVRFKIRQRFG